MARYGPHPFSIVQKDGEASALHDLPVAALRLDSAIADALMRLGLKRTGDLYGKPRAPIVKFISREHYPFSSFQGFFHSLIFRYENYLFEKNLYLTK